MDLIRHLDLFEAVACEGHFGRAAERMGIAQPPMSQAIRRLEAELGCVLFERTSSGAVLTPAGARVLEAARRAREAVGGVRAAAAEQAAAPVRLLVDPVLPDAWCTSIIRSAARSGLALDLEPTPTEEALRRARAADLPAVVLSPFRVEGLRASSAAAAPLWEARPIAPTATTTVLVHERAPAAFLSRLERELRGLALRGELRALPRSSALGLLAAARVHAVLWTEQPQLPEDLGADVEIRPVPVDRAAAVFHAVLRRSVRDRAAVAVHGSVSATLARIGHG
ncbi:LysR family transcriptional regulator [Brachybacterium hainanense]|uniref:LysR family transcriptional regulator n=1 Tax=Brachybacterium hainanense TaxID=1541174 RepID=A0ABV6RD04_9MICO